MLQHTEIASYSLPDDSLIQRLRGRPRRNGPADPDVWAIRLEGMCLNKAGDWEEEPSPSSRTDDFIERCRYASATQAHEQWLLVCGQALTENGPAGDQTQGPPVVATAPLEGAASGEVQPEPVALNQFLVIAYRWGWLNSHQYIHGQSLSLDDAMEMAREEADGRGGKYGVTVYQWWSDNGMRRVHHAPSTYGEEAPHHNHKLDMFSTIGYRAHEAATGGEALLVDRQSPAAVGGVMKHFPAEIPEWLDQVVRDEIKMAHFMGACDDNNRARREAGLAHMGAEENSAWCKQQGAASIVFADGQFAKRKALVQGHVPRIVNAAGWSGRRTGQQGDDGESGMLFTAQGDAGAGDGGDGGGGGGD